MCVSLPSVHDGLSLGAVGLALERGGNGGGGWDWDLPEERIAKHMVEKFSSKPERVLEQLAAFLVLQIRKEIMNCAQPVCALGAPPPTSRGAG